MGAAAVHGVLSGWRRMLQGAPPAAPLPAEPRAAAAQAG
jgi:hypothetical protein